ncbi:sprT domain-containing protein [Photobacterium frigidiphilum]|uniref:SprT domain-containing protein n=1 Tax=Photobacterium frigidiphilum TaxID=264736 RepID=A0A2T3J7N8_9GAMM|nr:SprT-like domain-containing protein [Photobacterium frigidiphilum]PSU44777.1 sprT domain-containing protein [Photobacterium frigidiphilum]
MKPTIESYKEFQCAFDFFNKKLFGNELPDCLITLQRQKKTFGYFSAQRFTSFNGEKTDEIAMNPTYFSTCSIVEVMQTLAHEMVHLWQYHYGKPGRGRYHNKEWAQKMEGIGLMPSSTGEEGGNKTGERISDYIIDGGQFDKACKKLLDTKFILSWADSFPDRKTLLENFDGETDEELQAYLDDIGTGLTVDDIAENKNKSTRVKYTCVECLSHVWGKPELNILCGDCDIEFITED